MLSYQVGPALQDGRLRIVLAEHEPEPVPIHIVHGEGRGASAKVRSFVDFAVAALRSNPMINRAETSKRSYGRDGWTRVLKFGHRIAISGHCKETAPGM